jgi:O-methyltransferase
MDSPACSRLRTLGWTVITKMLARKDMALVHAGELPRRTIAYRLFRDVREQTAMLMTDPEAWGIYASAKRTGRVPGDIAELGVFRGGSARLICEVKRDRALHLFDTFAGLPNSSKSDSRFRGGSFASSFDSVRSYLDPFPNVHFHVGMFPASAAGLDDLRFSFVHLDADLYESTLEGLRWFYPRLNRGGILISHDYYGSADGAGKAVHEYMGDKPEPFLELSGTQVAIVKL